MGGVIHLGKRCHGLGRPRPGDLSDARTSCAGRGCSHSVPVRARRVPPLPVPGRRVMTSDPAVVGIVGQVLPGERGSSRSSATRSTSRAPARGRGPPLTRGARCRQGLFKGEDANPQASSSSTFMCGLAAAHIAVNIPKELFGERVQPTVESWQRAHGKAGIQRCPLENRGSPHSGDVAFHRAEQSEKRR